MSALSLATLGVQCPSDKALSQASLGVFCIIIGGGDSSRRRKELREEYDELLHREDDEILSVILAISRKN